MVADHRAGRSGLLAPFLGRDAVTLPLPGAIAARYQTPIFVMTGHRMPDGRHQVAIAPLAVHDDRADEEQLRLAVTAACNDALGAAIRACPEQYFWYHRRWLNAPATDGATGSLAGNTP
jgi:KDO2-lipid IV(A) lauroyltransferase